MESLYMFSIMPPAAVTEKIEKERKRFAERYNCTKALKPPVHLTLYEPFKSSRDIEQRFLELHKWFKFQETFTIDLRNFSFFENATSPVVYIDVAKNTKLPVLRRTFLQKLKTLMPIEEKKRTFKPHFTIGYRDVSPEVFPKIMTEYSKRSFKDTFKLDRVYLWRHNGTNWQVQQEYKLGIDFFSVTAQGSLF